MNAKSKRIKIHIRNRSIQQWLVEVMLYFPFVSAFLTELLPLPSAIRYVVDLSCVFLLGAMGLQFFMKGSRFRSETAIWMWTMGFFAFAVLTYIFNFQSILYFLWGTRNNFLIYVAFFAYITYLDKKDVETILQRFDILFWINLVLSVFQFVVLRLYQDFLGGLFGAQSGVNAGTNLFLVIVVTRSFLLFLHKKEKTMVCLAKFAGAGLIAALAELKIFYVELVLIVGLIVLLTDFSWRKVYLVAAAGVGLAIGVILLGILFPIFRNYFSIEGILSIVASKKGYTYEGDLNRFTAVPEITRRFLRNPKQILFGLGLGNCDYSDSLRMFITPFYYHFYRLNYTWFQDAIVYLELGAIGLVFLEGFFVLCAAKGRELAKRLPKYSDYAYLTIVFSVCCVITTVYNSALRMQYAYFAYFILAIPFILLKGEYQKRTLRRKGRKKKMRRRPS